VLNGVAVDREAVPDPRLVAFAGGEPLLGFVAGLRDQKGLPVLLDALERLADGGELPRTAIVGNGPEAAEVDRRLADPRLAGRVTRFAFTGPMEHHLAALDLFVLPSLWEGLPIALLEAMAMGVAPVASAVGGTPEAVDDGRTGWLVPPGDAGALAGRLRAAMADGALRERVAAAAQAEAAARFGLERMVDELEALYVRVARA
jgi:glycosyltransferase involved in cell wall biosynthesis